MFEVAPATDADVDDVVDRTGDRYESFGFGAHRLDRVLPLRR